MISGDGAMLSDRAKSADSAVKRQTIRSRGRTIDVPIAMVDGRPVIVVGRGLKIASVHDEEWRDDAIDDPTKFLAHLGQSGLPADIFTFCEPLVGTTRVFPFAFEWSNAAVIRTTDVAAWWQALPQETRKNVRRAAKRGVVVTPSIFDDAFAEGIKRIYDESPIRQGRRFWHYGKDIAVVKHENMSYIERSGLIGAYCGPELIGFMKWVYVGAVARIMQVLTLNAHSDKRPMNALVAKAVEICNQKGTKYLVYGNLTYGNKMNDSMVEFKRRLGFEQANFRRYYAALTFKGDLALKLKLHRNLIHTLPGWMIRPLMALRHGYMRRCDRSSVA